MIDASAIKMDWCFEVGERVDVMEVVMVMNVVRVKVGYTLVVIEAYSMHKACRVDIDTEGKKLLRFGVEKYFPLHVWFQGEL